MKSVFLIGDQARIGCEQGEAWNPGWGAAVRDALHNRAWVDAPVESGRFAQYVVRTVHTWRRQYSQDTAYDLVYWNAGFCDVVRRYGDEPQTTIAQYAAMLVRASGRIERLFPGAKQMFSLTMPADESGNTFAAAYYNEDIARYNQAAQEALSGRGVIIDDMYTYVALHPEFVRLHSVCFDTESARSVGRRMADAIWAALEE